MLKPQATRRAGCFWLLSSLLCFCWGSFSLCVSVACLCFTPRIFSHWFCLLLFAIPKISLLIPVVLQILCVGVCMSFNHLTEPFLHWVQEVEVQRLRYWGWGPKGWGAEAEVQEAEVQRLRYREGRWRQRPEWAGFDAGLASLSSRREAVKKYIYI